MWIDAHWWFDYSRDAVCRTKAGDYEPGKIPDEDMEIASWLIPGLVEFARDNGLVPIIATNQSRGEDLKIIHRLLDVIEEKKE